MALCIELYCPGTVKVSEKTIAVNRHGISSILFNCILKRHEFNLIFLTLSELFVQIFILTSASIND